jgi:WD40 repeat protein
VSQPAAIPGLKSWSVELAGHSGRVPVTAWSPEGQLIATGDEAGTVRLWDPQCRLIQVLLGHGGKVTVLAWSAAGRYLASASDDRVLKLWNVATGAQVQSHVLDLDPGRLAWSGDGRKVAALGRGESSGWSVTSLLTQKTTGRSGNAVGMAWSSDGLTLQTLSTEGTIQGWDIETLGTESQQSMQQVPNSLTNAAWSPDGRWLAACCDGDSRLDVWDAATGKHRQTWIRGYPMAREIAWSPVSGKEEKVLEGHSGAVAGIAWSADGNMLATGSDDGTVRVWDLATGKTTQMFSQVRIISHRGLSWRPDGKPPARKRLPTPSARPLPLTT